MTVNYFIIKTLGDSYKANRNEDKINITIITQLPIKKINIEMKTQ